MAKHAAHGSRMWLDHYALASYHNSFDQGITQETPLVTTFADIGPRRVVGNYDYEVANLGFFDGAATPSKFDEIIHNLMDDDNHYFGLAPGSDSEGGLIYETMVANATQPRSGRVGEAILLNHTHRGRGGMFRGSILTNATILGTGARTGRNLGATTSGQILRVIHRIIAFTGTSLTIQFQESQDDGGGDAYATIAGMGGSGISDVGVLVNETTVATEAWKRLLLSGSYASVTLLTTVGVVSV